MFIGPTGAGKSSMAMQLAIYFAIGKECFGLRPTAKLRSLIIQAENDEGDLYEMQNGIFEGCGLTPSERAEASQGVTVCTINDSTGQKFIAKVKALVAKYKPDFLFIDPLLRMSDAIFPHRK